MNEPSPSAMWRTWNYLCEELGIRLAGSKNERLAAEYVASEFSKLGLANVQLETFPCRALQDSSVAVSILEGGAWQSVEARVLVGVPSTSGVVEGELVWLEMPEAGHRLTPGALKGKVAAIFGPLPTSVALHQHLVAAKPLAVIHVDDRLPFGWPKNDGVFPEWAERYSVPTTVTISYEEGWRWRLKGLEKVRIQASVSLAPGESQNVVGELPGTNPRAGAIVLGAHHDTQCENCGADDNASGVVALVEMARILAQEPRERSIRFVSFGTEEQLSVGSRAYALAHREELRNVALMYNFDSVSSVLGHNLMYRSGDPRLDGFTEQSLREYGLDVRMHSEVEPFSDHFCFSVFGVPALWLYRINFANCRWQHHSPHDNLENVSMPVMCQVLAASSRFIADLSNRSHLPFQRGFDPEQQEQILEWAESLFGIDRALVAASGVAVD